MKSGKRKKKQKKVPKAETPAPNSAPAWMILGAVFLLVALAMSFVLVLKHVKGINFPGCGPGSDCEELAESAWGKIPYLNLPVSHLGTAYFLGILVAWLSSRRGVPTLFRYLVRVGLLGSIVFTIVMIVEKHLCPYCVGVHIANLAFWIVVESTRKPAPQVSVRPLAALCGVFILSTAILGAIEWRTQQALNERGERELGEDITRMIAATEQATAAASTTNGDDQAATTTSPAATQPAVAESSAEDDYPFKQGFRGRYLYGPEKAAVRIVILTDYQCKDCYRIENEIRSVLKRHDNVSLYVKHYPFCKACNKRVNRDLHPNACWAARAAEAAGIMWGDEGFHKMHNWLFDHKGLFQSTQEIEDGIRSMGYDPTGFVQLLANNELTLPPVLADIEEGQLLGLFQTPMIFINGVEMRSWYAPNAVVRAVEAVLAQNPEPQTHANDRPSLALDKLIGDWREQPVRRMPPDRWPWARGPDEARVNIAVWGDYQEKTTAEADGIIREWMQGRDDVRYTFRHYPFNKECNDKLGVDTRHQQACWAARAAEAAGRLAGSDGYWRMHEWLMTHQDSFTDEALRDAVTNMGLDPEVLLTTMREADILAAIQDDCATAKQLSLRAIPLIYINNKLVMRWRFQGPEMGRRVIEGILKEAASE
ncbi:MAG: DsbA family protein [Planctomycetota bacterium]